jgi:hypothetical protein
MRGPGKGMNRQLGQIMVVLAGVLAAAFYFAQPSGEAGNAGQGVEAESPRIVADIVEPAPAPVRAAGAAKQAFTARDSGRMLEVSGTVERILPDDRDGSPHQRFIIRTDDGISLLIAHNLDLAPRLDGLREGEGIRARGEYEWNEKGGLMHWTHPDPAGRHPPGFIEWRGRRYP